MERAGLMQKESSRSGAWVIWVWLVVVNLLLRVDAAEPAVAGSSGDLLLVVGAPGTEEYAIRFGRQVQEWRRVAESGGLRFHLVGQSEEAGEPDRDVFRQCVEDLENAAAGPLWVVLAGHGTFDGVEARFNLRGPDLSGSELAMWLRGVARPMVLVHAFSSSAPFMKAVAAKGRVVITSTRSGYEQSYSRFGDFFPLAFLDLEADLDRDGQVSLLEAFLVTGNRVEEWYRTEGRLATEHAVMDDNGDGLGVGRDWFRGLRVVGKARGGEGVDGRRARQFYLVPSEAERNMAEGVRARRDELELAVYELGERRSELGEETYYRTLEELLLRLAELYQEVD
jgi:hypothetical protein